MRNGAFSKATAALTSDGVAPRTATTFEIIKEKFPNAPHQDQDELKEEILQHETEVGQLDPSWAPLEFITENLINDVVNGFKNSDAPDQSGVSVSILKFVCWAGFTSIIILVLKDYLVGRLPKHVCDYLSTGSVVPLWKNSEHTDVRPISVPSLLARILAKGLNKRWGKDLGKALAPKQIGVNGFKAIDFAWAQLTTRLMKNPDLCMLKFDLRNAYGSISQTLILKELRKLGCPMLVQYFIRMYTSARAGFELADGTMEFLNIDTGIFQGDPLSGLFFSIGLQPVLESLAQTDISVVTAYLDDIFLICSKQVAKDLVNGGGFQAVLDGLQSRLTANLSKCEIFSFSDLGDANDWRCRISTDGFTILGIPGGAASFIKDALTVKLDQFRKTLSLIPTLQVQSALLLLRYCGINRLNYLFRCVPAKFTGKIAASADDIIWKTVKSILAIPEETQATELLLDLNRARTLSQLPLSKGGMGLTNPASTLTGAYLAGIKEGLQQLKATSVDDFNWLMSVLDGTEEIVDGSMAADIRSSVALSLTRAAETLVKFRTTPAFKALESSPGRPLSDSDVAARYPTTLGDVIRSEGKLQQDIVFMGQAVLYEDFLATLSAPNLAVARGSATPHAKDFLRMHPSSRDHRLTDADMRYGARQVLFLPPTNDMFVVPSVQQLLVGGVEVRKDAFTEFRARFRECHAWPRHNNLTTLFIKMLRSLRFSVLPSNRVPVGQIRGEADFLVYGLSDELGDVAFDVSVTTSDSLNLVTRSAAVAGVAAEKRAQEKRDKYAAACSALGIGFSPLILEDTGYLHPTVHAFLSRLSESDGSEDCIPESTTWAVRSPRDFWYQAISRNLVAGNAQIFREARSVWFDKHTGCVRARRV